MGDPQEAKASWGAGYIDDMILCALGPIRMVAMLNNLWKICDDWRIPVAKGKAVFGQRVTVIGYEFRTRTLRFKLTDNKVHLLRAWFRRLRDRRGMHVEVKELTSLIFALIASRESVARDNHAAPASRSRR